MATAFIGASMAKALNRKKEVSGLKKFKGTIPITLLLLSLEVGGAALWASKEWLGVDAAITHVVTEHRELEENRALQSST